MKFNLEKLNQYKGSEKERLEYLYNRLLDINWIDESAKANAISNTLEQYGIIEKQETGETPPKKLWRSSDTTLAKNNIDNG
jgi:hypothetical protein